MRLNLTSLLFTLLLLIAKVYPVSSQSITFNKVVSPIGSFSGIVGGIAQDKNGYVWFATGGGLFRYDGYRFKMYSHDPANKNSLSSQRLETVFIDSKGIIWIATLINGIDRFDPITGEFTHFQNDPKDPTSLSHNSARSFLEDRDGVLWVGTWKGLDKYDSETGKFQHFQHNPNDPESISSNAVRKIYEDKAGTLWVGTGSVWAGEDGGPDDGGLNRFDKKTGKFIRYKHDPNNPHSLISNKIQAIFEDSRGNFWIGTDGDGLHTMNRKTGLFERHLYNPGNPEKLSRPLVTNSNIGLDHITFINEDALGGIWIGTLSNGITHYNPETGRLNHYVNEHRDSGFPDNSGWSFCSSRDGTVWIGTFQGGLFRIDPYHTVIPYSTIGSAVNAFAEDPDNNLWIGTSAGLIRQNRTTNNSRKFVHDNNDPSSLSSDNVHFMLKDKKEICG
jgi:ligand-binding sensor domain-containing protein